MSSLPPNVGQPGQPARADVNTNVAGQPTRPVPAAQPASQVQEETRRKVDTGASPPVDPLTNHPLRYTAGKQADTKQRGKDKPVNEQTPKAEEENKRLADEEKQRQENQSDEGVV